MARAHRKKHGSRLIIFTLLLVPFSIYILLYVMPLGAIISQSIDNSVLSEHFANYSEQIGQNDKDKRASALLQDMEAMSAREQGQVARMLNQEFSGFRSLFLTTARATSKIAPSHQGFVAFDKKWDEQIYWDILDRNAERFTWRHFQSATGLQMDDSGALTIAEDSDIYLRIMLRTLVISLQVMLLTLLIGYPLAYAVANSTRRFGNFVLMVILLSFWTSILVRTTAWVVLLQTNGVLNNFLIWLGIISEPVQLIFNRFGTLAAMTHVLLPFAIIPMMNVMRTIPKSQRDASYSLGAGATETFLRVYFPQSLRGVVVAGGIVFILALGFYVTPALTGGPGDQMLSYYIAEFIMRSLNWGMASALSVMLLGGVLALLGVFGALRWLGTYKRSAA